MKDHHHPLVVLTLLALAGSGGCKAKAPAKAPPVTAQSAVTALAPDQWKAFCETMEPRQADSPEERCRRDAFKIARAGATPGSNDTQLQTWCRTSYEACLRSPPARPSQCAQRAAKADCAATVGEVAACAKAVTELRRAALARIPACDALTVSIASGPLVAEPPKREILALAPCQTLQAKCASLFR